MTSVKIPFNPIYQSVPLVDFVLTETLKKAMDGGVVPSPQTHTAQGPQIGCGRRGAGAYLEAAAFFGDATRRSVSQYIPRNRQRYIQSIMAIHLWGLMGTFIGS